MTMTWQLGRQPLSSTCSGFPAQPRLVKQQHHQEEEEEQKGRMQNSWMSQVHPQGLGPGQQQVC